MVIYGIGISVNEQLVCEVNFDIVNGIVIDEVCCICDFVIFVGGDVVIICFDNGVLYCCESWENVNN